MHSPTPPRIPERLLSALVPDDNWRASIIGDLREEFAEVARRSGLRVGRRWYWRQALAIGSRTVAARVTGRQARPQPWIALAEAEPRGSWLSTLPRDVLHAWRGIVRRPSVSIVVVVTLALAIAANSVMFGLLDAFVLRPFRFLPNVDRLIVAASTDGTVVYDRESVANADFNDWRRETRTLQLTATEWWDANLSGNDLPEQVPGFYVGAEFFDVFAVPLPLGRGFLASEEVLGQHRRVVLGHDLWTRRFAADRNVVGQAIRVDGEPYEVIGVAPPGFAMPDGAQIWAPLAKDHAGWADRRGTFLTVIGQLRDGVTIEQARADMEGIVARLRTEYPDTNGKRPFSLTDFTTGMGDPGAKQFLLICQIAAFLLLLIACANIVNLLLARGAERAQEFAIRLAMGAGRLRLVRQMLVEGALFGVLAIALAVPLIWMSLGLTRASLPASIIRFIPGWRYIGIETSVLIATMAIGVAAAIVFSIVPAIQASRGALAGTLRQTGRTLTAGRRRLWGRNVLATAQVALTLALLFASGLMLRGADRAVNGFLGFDKRDVLTARVALPEATYAEPTRRLQFIDGVLDRMRQIPAVTDAAMASNLPSGGTSWREIWPEGVATTAADVRTAYLRRVSDDFFTTLRIPLLAGRVFNSGDRAQTVPVAVISRGFAERYWPSGDAIGRRLRFQADGPLMTVIGVVGDARADWATNPTAPTIYRPMAQDAPFAFAFAVRTSGDPMQLATDLRRAVIAMDADQPLTSVNSLEGVVEDRAAGVTFIARAIGVVAAIAFVLAMTGLYSLVAYNAAQRTQEFGIRMALGARRWDVIRLTTRQALGISAAGAVIGGGLAALLGRLMEATLLGAVVNSFAGLAALIATLMLVTMVAAYLPARRAASISPTAALRAD